jgi:hypothetical protein
MVKNRKYVKVHSIVVFTFVLFSLERLIVDVCLYGFGVANVVLKWHQ